jgi:D-alanine-D-alanine ligase
MTQAILLFGGRSDERLVSVASAQNLASNYPFAELWFLHDSGEITLTNVEELSAHQRAFETPFAPLSTPFAPSIQAALDRLQGKTVFIGLHGTEGEDGTLQKLFEDHHIAFTGSGSLSSRNCFDKRLAKQIVRSAGVAVAEDLEFSVSPTPSHANHSGADAHFATKDLTSKDSHHNKATNKDLIQNDLSALLSRFFDKYGRIVVKPRESGSSFGLHIIHHREQITAAVSAIISGPYRNYLAEAFIEGRELTVGVMEENGELRALPASEVVLAPDRCFDYQGKYLGRGTTEITPADLSDQERRQAGLLATRAHEALSCFGYSRTDMILTKDGPIFLETNTLPGMTRASFIPQQLHAAGWDLRSFIDLQLSLANRNLSRTQSLQRGK